MVVAIFIRYGLSEYIIYCSKECLVHSSYLLLFFFIVTFSISSSMCHIDLNVYSCVRIYFIN